MGIKVLVVEDEANARKGLAQFLEARLDGIEVLQAEDGAEGLRLALAEHPDVIITGNLMPVVSGLELIVKLREARVRTRVILVTAHFSEIENTVARLRICAVLQKPYEATRLIEAVKSFGSRPRGIGSFWQNS